MVSSKGKTNGIADSITIRSLDSKNLTQSKPDHRSLSLSHCMQSILEVKIFLPPRLSFTKLGLVTLAWCQQLGDLRPAENISKLFLVIGVMEDIYAESIKAFI